MCAVNDNRGLILCCWGSCWILHKPTAFPRDLEYAKDMGPLWGYWGVRMGILWSSTVVLLFKHQKQNRIAEVTYGAAPEAYFSGHEACQIQPFQSVFLRLILNRRTWWLLKIGDFSLCMALVACCVLKRRFHYCFSLKHPSIFLSKHFHLLINKYIIVVFQSG